MGKQTVDDCRVEGKRVLMRVDFNVPMDHNNRKITDDERIRAAIPTIRHLMARGARVILMSHLGRPKGKVVEELRMAPIAEKLSELLDQPVRYVDECIGEKVENIINEMNDGEVLMLENVRFYPEEEKNDINFSKSLAKLGDVFVNDAFGTAHRSHCSTVGVGHYLPTVAGYLIKNEISALARVIVRPVRPFLAIVGGAKISDKIAVIENLITQADIIIIGGGMANTFLAAQGYDMKSSLIEKDKIDLAKEILKRASESGKTFLLPIDVTVTNDFNNEDGARNVSVSALKDGEMALDIGKQTRYHYCAAIENASTIFWNGPMGVFEKKRFAEGTNTIANAVANCKGYTIVGGGDSVAAIHQAGLADKINHISTGGGASLAFIEGRILPGLAIIAERDDDVEKKPLFMANWKMNKTASETLDFLEEFNFPKNPVDIVICAPFTALPALKNAGAVHIGAQNFYPESAGAYTGEISVDMLKEYHVEYVLVGHSERRQLFHEDDEMVARKYHFAAKSGLIPVLCVGETLEERQAGVAEKRCGEQIAAVFSKSEAEELPAEIIIAYEPIWAIGTGLTATAEDAQAMASAIRQQLKKYYGEEFAQKTRILYGGSVHDKNSQKLMGQIDIDGALVGGASLQPKSFEALIQEGCVPLE